MECKCGNKNAVSWRAGFFKNDAGEREPYEYCDKCGGATIAHFDDVFWDGRPEENLADGPDGKPITFFSRGDKARYLKERGICEAGDRVHGAPVTSMVSKDKAMAKAKWHHDVAEARRKVASMGQDVRRQAILKVIKESRQYAEAT